MAQTLEVGDRITREVDGRVENAIIEIVGEDTVIARVVKGDFIGHPFRGNQWSESGGISDNEKVPSKATIKLLTGKKMTDKTLATLGNKSLRLVKKQGPRIQEDMQDGMFAWRSSDQLEMARHMRGKKDGDGFVKRAVAGLTKRFDKASIPLPADSILYRGVDFPKGTKLVIGQTFTDRSFQASTIDRSIAKGYAVDAMLVIHAPKGTRVLPGGWELRQLIIDRNTKLVVTGITSRRTGGPVEISAQIVGDQ